MARLPRMTNVHAVMNKPIHAAAGVRSHVLAVDDDPVIREAISDYLGQYDFRITAVADGRAMQAVLAPEGGGPAGLDPQPRDEGGVGPASPRRQGAADSTIIADRPREQTGP